MDILNFEKIKALMNGHNEPCVSLFIPTFVKGAETEQNRIRFKNIVGEAEKMLSEQGYRRDMVEKVMKPAHDMISNSEFWNYQSEGLAFFLSPNDYFYYRLPLPMNEKAVISDRFYIKPLLTSMSGDERYFVLALGQKNLKFYQGSRFNVHEIQLKNVPTDISEITIYDDPEKSLQFHTGASTTGAGSERAAVFHGHGIGMDDKKQKGLILEFFQNVDKGLKKKIGGENAPLILVGLEYMIPLYKEANSYPHLFQEGVDVNPEELNNTQLHERVWKVIEPHFDKQKERAHNEYSSQSGKQVVSNKLDDIVSSAYNKRVSHLFLNPEFEAWGKYDLSSDTVEIHDKKEKGDYELADLCAMHTILNGGLVYVLSKNKMPGSNDIAAVFRY